MDSKRLIPIVLIIFVNILGGGVILPILPLYAEGQFRGTVLQVTLLATAFNAAQFVAAPWLGRLSDQYGRRPILLISQLGTVVAFVMFIFAAPVGSAIDALQLPLPMTGGMLMLFAARILDGITGGNITTARAYISDVTPPEHRAQALGLIEAAFGVGFVFGPAFGGLLAGFGPVVPFIGAALITSLTLLLTYFVLEESLPPARPGDAASAPAARVPLRDLLANGAITNLLLIGFFAALAFAALPATFALFANQVLFADAAEPSRIPLFIGLMLSVSGVFQIATQLFLLRRVARWLGERRAIILGEAALAVGMLGLAWATSPVVAMLLFAPLAIGIGVSEPNLQSIITRFGSKRTRGQLLGASQSARSLALIFGPVWAGFVFARFGPHAVYLVAGLLVLCAALLAVRLYRQPLRGAEPLAGK